MKKYKIAILAMLGCIGLMGFSTEMNIGIKDMFDKWGRVKQIKLSTGQTYPASTLATIFGGGSGNASYPIDLAGTETTGINTVAKGGTGSNTAAGARTNLGLGTLATQDGTFSGTSSGTNTGDNSAISQADAEGGTSTTSYIWSPQRVFQSIVARLASAVGITMQNVTITGTNSTAIFRTVTVTETLESGSHQSTAGTASTTVGVGQSYRIISKGSSTNSISLECDGPIYANNGTTSVDLTHMPQIWAKGSSTAGVTSVITGTTQGTFTSFTVPANSMGKVGMLEISPLVYTSPSTPSYTATYTLYIYDGIATTTVWNVAGYNTIQTWICLRNTGSTSTNISYPPSRVTTLENTNLTASPYTIRTGATMTVTLTGYASIATGTVNLGHCEVSAKYVD